jgi:hypothetical protein
MSRCTNSNTVYTSRGKPCGYVRGHTFYRKFNPDKHILKSLEFPALAFDVTAIEQATRAGADTIEAFDGLGTVYRCSLEHFRRAAKLINLGYGDQLALVLTGFITIRRGEACQLPLWGGAR